MELKTIVEITSDQKSIRVTLVAGGMALQPNEKMRQLVEDAVDAALKSA